MPRLLLLKPLPPSPGREPLVFTGQPMVVRTYRGSAAEAAGLYQREAVTLAQHGYLPISQVYTPGSWGCAEVLLAVILVPFLVGVLVLLYLLLARPPGTLTVTFQLQAR